MEGIEVKYSGKISDEAFEMLKKKHGDVYTMEIPANDEGTEIAVGYLKKVERSLMDAYLYKSKTNPIDSRELLLRGIWLEGDKRILDDDDLFYSAALKVDEMIMVRVATLKKN